MRRRTTHTRPVDGAPAGPVGGDVGIRVRDRQSLLRRARRSAELDSGADHRPEPTWAAAARIAAGRWVELEDQVRILTGRPGRPFPADAYADVDLTLTQVALLVTTIPVPGADAVRAGLESVQSDLRAGHRPDVRLMACIARWLRSAATS